MRVKLCFDVAGRQGCVDVKTDFYIFYNKGGWPHFFFCADTIRKIDLRLTQTCLGVVFLYTCRRRRRRHGESCGDLFIMQSVLTG